MILDKTRRKVYFNKTTAILWIIAGILAFIFGWIYAIVFTAIASIYANVKADWSTAEAADNRELKEQNKQTQQKLDNILEAIKDGTICSYPGNCSVGVFCVRDVQGSDTVESSSGGPVLSSTSSPTERNDVQDPSVDQFGPTP